ncbi:replication-associated recombination protein A [Pseudooceanicola sp. CBS1P-1]|uniref:Replication-associated recombination protein A n=1 Tax=Pseudooceanicola albus TaxID=2692189 RepID=A0A6L7G890_9RHOB|nr:MULTISPECIES: replication-associated recombination protein A [Pseudooceanicola]MBT9384400.1 replication-associated recombination protein A [Pseudooceanicola endophyticus]MXN19862.1 AAA family ATPase [Pseudooceanicola albus]
MSDLFDAAPREGHEPLASVLRPKTLDDVIGQSAIVRPGSILRRRIAAGALGSIILYGPPGVGKTSIARAVGNMLGKEFCQLHATRATVAELRKLSDEARIRPLLIFVDEIHRFSSTQADDLLAICENGTADFIGATTGNPYHALTPALVSRSTILQLEPITLEEMEEVVRRGLAHLQGQGIGVTMTPEQIRLIAGRSGGDARRALTTLESLAVGHDGPVEITEEMLEEAYASAAVNHDRSGDQHYDIVSAFVKSMRGSDADATLYWLARMIHAGEDPRYIARRIMIHASEDVGLADNTALQTAVAAATAVEKIGYPEARIILAHAALHVARAPKSNSACRGIGLALSAVTQERPALVPKHLRDAHYKGAEALGHKGYRFPHDDPRGWVEQDYVTGLEPGRFYQSDARDAGTFEKRADSFWEQVHGQPAPRRFPKD